MKRNRHRMHGIDVLYEDDDVIVIEKAAGVLTCAAWRGDPSYTVEDALSDYVRKGQLKSRRRVYLVHRLDRETSGVMMVAKSEAVQARFRADWNALTEKTYLARVAGEMPAAQGVFESYLAEDPRTLKVRSVPDAASGKFARTEWRVLPEPGCGPAGTTLVEARLHTGRRNQIRVQFAEAGHPVVGDAKYGARAARGARLCLHALTLAFAHPRTGRRMEFSSARPAFASPPAEKGART